MELTQATIKKLEDIIPNLEGMISTIPDMQKKIESFGDTINKDGESFKTLGKDIAGLKETVEKTKANHESLVEEIRKNKGGLYTPGVEDTAKKFSIISCYKARITGDWAKHAPFELEVIKAVQDRHGNAIQKTTVNTLQENEGGSFVPDQVIPDVIGAIYKRSVFIALEGASVGGQTRMRVIDGMIGGTVKIPRFNGGMVAYWIDENDDIATSKIGTANVTMTPKKLTAAGVLTEEMLKFTSYGLEQLFRQDLINAMAEELDRVVMYGSGSANQPRGLLNMMSKGVHFYDASTGTFVTTPPAAADNSGGELDFDDLDEMQGKLEDVDLAPGPSAMWISAPRFWRRLKKIKVDAYENQSVNRAYLLGMPMISDPRLQSLIGNFDKTTKIQTNRLPGVNAGWPTLSTDEVFGDVIFGNLQELILGRWFGLEIVDDMGHTNFLKDQMIIKSRLYVDVQTREEKNFVVCPNAQMQDIPA